MSSKTTNIQVQWSKKKGTVSMKTTFRGAKLPNDVRIMLLNQLLDFKKYRIRVDK